MQDDATLIRFTLGATGTNAGLLSDDEVTTATQLYTDWRLAAASLAEQLAAKAINNPSSFGLTGTMQVSWTDRAKSWMAIAKNLREEAARLDTVASGPVGMQVTLLQREFVRSEDEEYTPSRVRSLER